MPRTLAETLRENMQEKHEIMIECIHCQEGTETDYEADGGQTFEQAREKALADFVDELIKSGWVYAGSDEYQQEGLICPECARTEESYTKIELPEKKIKLQITPKPLTYTGSYGKICM